MVGACALIVQAEDHGACADATHLIHRPPAAQHYAYGIDSNEMMLRHGTITAMRSTTQRVGAH